MAKVRYVLVGFGGIAENRVAKEGYACDRKRFRPLKTAQLVGATDVNQARKAAAEALGLKWYASLDDVLADKSVDGVYIATNNAWNIAAAKAVQSGSLGKVNDSCFHMEFAYGYDPAEAATWRCGKVEEMGGPIGDVASHCFYVAEFIFGKKIAKVAAVYYPKVMKIRAEDGAYIKFFFEDGTQGSVNAAFSEMRGGLAGTLTNLGYEVYGDKAAMRGFGTMFQLSGYADEPIRIRLERDDGKGVSEIKPGKIQNIYQALIEGHAKSVQAGKPLTAQDAIHNLALCAAAHRSAQNGGKVVSVSC